MEIEGLQKYMVEGMVADELAKEQTGAFAVLNEDGNIMPTANVSSYMRPNDVHRLIVQSLMEEAGYFPYSPAPTNILSGTPQNPINSKVEKTRKIVQIIQDMLWRISDSSLSGDDDSINKAVQDACNPLIKSMVHKLNEIWTSENSEQKPEEPKEQKPEEPKEPKEQKPEEHKDQPTSATEIKPTGSKEEFKSPVVLTFTQGESIKSPQNKEYIIEAVNGSILSLKDKATGARATVNIEIAKKWKNRKGA